MTKHRTIVDEALEAQIEPQEILHLVTEMTKRHGEGQEVNWYTQVGILADRFPGKSPKLFAISQRMQCLIEVMKDPRMRGWTFEVADPNCLITNEAVFRATALAPLHLTKDRITFDPEEFFLIVLGESEPEARA
jgi:hypothetical protein